MVNITKLISLLFVKKKKLSAILLLLSGLPQSAIRSGCNGLINAQDFVHH